MQVAGKFRQVSKDNGQSARCGEEKRKRERTAPLPAGASAALRRRPRPRTSSRRCSRCYSSPGRALRWHCFACRRTTPARSRVCCARTRVRRACREGPLQTFWTLQTLSVASHTAHIENQSESSILASSTLPHTSSHDRISAVIQALSGPFEARRNMDSSGSQREDARPGTEARASLRRWIARRGGTLVVAEPAAEALVARVAAELRLERTSGEVLPPLARLVDWFPAF